MPKRLVRLTGFGGFPGWRGVNRQGSPASIAPDQLRNLVNATWSGGAIRERGGQSKLFSSPQSPTFVNGIYDSSMSGGLVGGTAGGGGGGGPLGTGGGDGSPTGQGDGPKIYWPATAGGHAYVMFFDEEKTGAPYSNNVFEVDTTLAIINPSTGNSFGWGPGNAVQWNGQLWWAQGNTVDGAWALFSQDPVYGTNQPQPVMRANTPVTVTNFRSGMGVWRGKLYISVSRTFASDNPITYEFNGTTLRQFDDSGFTANATGQPFGYQDKLYVAYQNANNVIRIITIAGSGINATMPSTRFDMGTAYGYSFAEYKGVLYVGGSDGNGDPSVAKRGIIYSLAGTGTTFSVANDLGTPPTPNPVRCLAVFNGYLYYHWTDTANGSVSRIGRYDGTTWTNSHFTFSAGPPIEGPFQQMYPYKGSLVVTSTDIDPDVPAWRSAGTNTTSWSAMQSGSTSGRERINFSSTPFF